MATLQQTDVEILRTHLEAGGFFDPFTDINGDSQPAPIFQGLELDTTVIDETERVILIRTTGGVRDVANRNFYKKKGLLIAVIGLKGANDLLINKGLSDDIDDWLVNNPFGVNCNIANIETAGAIGPFETGDKRRVFEINTVVTFNRKQTVF